MKIQRQIYYGQVDTIDDLTNIVNTHYGFSVYVWLAEPITIRGITLARYTQIFIPYCSDDVIGFGMYPQVVNQPVVVIGRGGNDPDNWFIKQI